MKLEPICILFCRNPIKTNLQLDIRDHCFNWAINSNSKTTNTSGNVCASMFEIIIKQSYITIVWDHNKKKELHNHYQHRIKTSLQVSVILFFLLKMQSEKCSIKWFWKHVSPYQTIYNMTPYIWDILHWIDTLSLM